MAQNNVLYGFVNLADQFQERVATIDETTVASAIGVSVEWHNQRVNEMLALFATPTTEYSKRFVGIAQSILQPMDENGRPKSIKSSSYSIAFPQAMAGAAIGWNFVSGAKMTVAQLNALIANVLMADLRWMRLRILTALFQNASFTYPDPLYGDQTVYGLANGDATLYATNAGDTLAADTHYLAQAAGIDDSNSPFQTIYNELVEHPENSGDVIVFIPTNLVTSIEALADFVPVADADIRQGVASDVLVGALGATYPGEVRGKVSKCWIVEWKSLPDSYMLGVTSSGESPLAMRQDPEPELQGLKLQGVDEYTPWHQRNWYRRAGFGALNRAGAVVYRVGNGSYAIPTGYTGKLG